MLLVAPASARRPRLSPTPPPRDRQQRLRAVSSWTYQLQRLDGDPLPAAATDLLVIDYAHDGSEPRELWPIEVAARARKSDGRRRPVLAYLSVGEAEDYRFYWDAAWDLRLPGWMLPATCRWPGNHAVHFWRREWKDLIYAGRFSYLRRIQDGGFDGVYLDRIDAYADVEAVNPRARNEMIALVRDLAATARRRDPRFIVVAQNAEELLEDRSYRAAIDAVAKEDLFLASAATASAIAADIASSTAICSCCAATARPY